MIFLSTITNIIIILSERFATLHCQAAALSVAAVALFFVVGFPLTVGSPPGIDPQLSGLVTGLARQRRRQSEVQLAP